MSTHPIGLAIVQAGVSSPGDPLVVRQVAGSLGLVEEKALPQSGGVVVPGGNNRSKKQHHHAQHHRRSRHCPDQLSGRKRQCRWVLEEWEVVPIQERGDWVGEDEVGGGIYGQRGRWCVKPTPCH